MSSLPSIVGRGVATNPKNRFERLEVTPDLDELDYELAHDKRERPQTFYYKDTSKTFITYNNSPDIGYNASVNPYRGCSHGCVYCLVGETQILLADGTVKQLKDIRIGDTIYGTVKREKYRYYVKTRVLAHWQTEKEAYRITLEDGTTLIASGDHRFLSKQGWKYVSGVESTQHHHLTVNDCLISLGSCVSQNITEQAIENTTSLRIVSVEALNTVLPMYDITTGTGDFIANGVVSHNCYARQTHEYLGFSAGLDFETQIMVKSDAPKLLRKELSAKSWQPQLVGFSGVTDIYQPIEKQLQLTRRCLEVFLDFRNPVGMVTKNYLITRDIDLLQELAKYNCVSVCISITTLDNELRRLMEPRTSSANKRLESVRKLAEAGIHVGVLTAPIIPGLTDHEIPSLVQAAKDAGAKFVGYNIVHLPFGVKDIFESWIKQTYPERAERVLNRIREMRGGKLNDPRFGFRMSGEGIYAEQIKNLYKIARKKAGFEKSSFKVSTEHFRVPGRSVQKGLFD
jgi:DNA repair photolyase